MKKIYMQPNLREIILDATSIIATSGEGGLDGGKTGNEYTSTDVTYSRENTNLWDQEW